jgi:hypothetical protein
MSFRLGKAKFASRAGGFALAVGCACAIVASPALAEGGISDFHWLNATPPSGAAFSVSPAASGSPSTFDASASTAAAGTITAYHWTFGDGSSADSSTSTIAHTYATAGSYTATLTETDSVVVSFFGLHYTQEHVTAPVSQTFVVPGPPPPPPPVPVVAPPPPVQVSPSAPATIGPRGNVWVWLTCPRTARAGCHGTVTIQLAGGSSQGSRGRHTHTITSRCARVCRALGSATYQARAGQRIHIRVHMASFVRRLLTRQHSVAVRLTVTSVAGVGIARHTTTITLRSRRHSSR